MHMRKSTRGRASIRQATARRGTALMELAVCLPLVVMITMATIEACSVLYLKQALKIAAYEGCRTGLVPSATVMNARAQSEELLNSRDIRGYTINITPDPNTLRSGQLLKVEVRCKCADNLLLHSWFYKNKLLSESVEMVKDT